MGNSTTSRHDAIRHEKNQLLYAGIRYSAVGSFAAALVALLVFEPLTDRARALAWFTIVILVYCARLIDLFLYQRSAQQKTQADQWSRRFGSGALLSAIAWASSMWLIFPQSNQAHQALLVLTLGGVAAGALASLPYDKKLILTFQTIIIASVAIRLVVEGEHFSLELAVFSLFIFGFLLSCGKQVSINYHELLHLKQDSQEINLTLIKTTERMAQTGYWQWDQTSGSIKLSDNLAAIWGLDDKVALIKNCFKQVHKHDRSRIRHSFNSVLEHNGESSIEYRMLNSTTGKHRNMRQVIKRINDSLGNASLLGTVQDITDIKSAEQKIYNMAYYDGLTGLANRAYFHEHLETYVAYAQREEHQFAVIYIDLDNFKGVNDSYGHECGDIYLKRFANHVSKSLRQTDFVARLGGDEFCILLPDIKGTSDAIISAERCLEITEHTMQIGNHRIHPKLSIGISIYPDDGSDPDEIVKSADLAMYYAKQNNNQRYAFYEAKMAAHSLERVKLEADLRLALDNDEFELWYQPKVDILNDRISGVEALIRWRHPDRGIVAPDLFISIAERVGMIKDIGEWVVQTACQQLYEWNQQGYRLQMAVNISGDHFAANGFVEFINSTVKLTGISSNDLEVEITESLSRDPTAHSRVCHELRSTGIRVAIDDFGTGYSSLSVLSNLEVDTLKIDRSFIQGLPEQHSSKLMVKAIIELSLGLGYDVVAEGVETKEQLEFLRLLNCPFVQGYYFSKPQMAADIQLELNADHQAHRSA
ncbi:MAG: EAL domain-containing protein [Granulosicoccus sp.]